MTPYELGYHAGARTGPFKGATSIPPCLFKQGTPEHASWDRGFDDATDDLWNPAIQGWGENE